MAVTKIHPIEKTLYLALDYIMNEDKTDGKILISSFACNLCKCQPKNGPQL